MTLTLGQLVGQFKAAATQYNGSAVAGLLGFKVNGLNVLSRHLKATGINVDAFCSNRLPEDWSEVMANHIHAAVELLVNSDVVAAYRAQAKSEDIWLLDTLRVIALDLRLLAMDAHREVSVEATSQETPGGDIRGDAAQQLQKCFRTCMKDRAPNEVSKKWATLHLVCQLFKLYFSMNRLNLCKNLIAAIEEVCDLPFEEFHVSDRVTYRYFTGRLAAFESNFPRAESCLEYALQHCRVDMMQNRRLILLYLIPVRLLLGKMPSQRLLRKYQLVQFVDLIAALRQGNVSEFAAQLAKHQMFFTKLGIYLNVERTRLIAIRNLVMRVLHIVTNSQIKLNVFERAFNAVGMDVDLDETECLLANLIYRRLLRGYISHEKATVVLAKKSPCPPLSQVNMLL